MKRFFSLKLYIEGLKRIKIAGVAAAITVILLNAMIPLMEILNNNRLYGMGGIVEHSVTSVEPYEFLPFGLLMLVFSAVFAFSMFSFLNERNRSDFFHAIPHKRICVYLSFVASIFTWIFGILAVSAGVNVLLYSFAKFYSVNFSVVIVTPLVLLVASTMIAAFMTLAMTLTGTVISNSLIFVLLLLFGRTIGQIFVSVLRELAPILRHGNSFLDYLEFEFSLPFMLLGGEGFDNTPLVIYTVFVTLFVFAAGAVCYVKRKSETATKSAPSKLMQHVYRSAITLPFFLFIVLTAITEGFDFSTQLILLILAILVYCLFELMTTKKLKSLVKAIPMIFIPILLSGLFTGAVYLARNAVLNQVPTLDEIKAIGLQESVSYNATYRELRINNTLVDSDEAEELVRNALVREIEQIRKYGNRSGWAFVDETGKTKIEIATRETINIRLENGRTIGRYIGFTKEEFEELKTFLLASDDYFEAYLALPSGREIDSVSVDGYDIDAESANLLWASFVREFHALSREEKLDYVNNSYRTEEVARIYIGGTYRLKTFHSSYPIFYEYMPETSRMYLEMALEEGYVSSDIKVLKAMSEKLETVGTVFEEYIDFDITATKMTGNSAGEEYYVNSIKGENPFTPSMAKRLLDFLIEKGEPSYDEEKILVRFRIGLYAFYSYSYENEEAYKASVVTIEKVDEGMSVSNLFLSFEKEEWEEFKALISVYQN